MAELARGLPNGVNQPTRAHFSFARDAQILISHHVEQNHCAHALHFAVSSQLLNHVPATISVIRQWLFRIGGIRVLKFFPAEAKSFFTGEKNEPERQLL